MSHHSYVTQVYQCLLENLLFIKAEKCAFHRQEVSFLGLIISPGLVNMDPDKFKAVTDWPTLMSRKEFRCILGFANFYWRFNHNYSSIVALSDSTCILQQQYSWNSEAKKAFSTIKGRFTSAPVLSIPDPVAQFVLEVDTSNTGDGAVLSQRSPIDYPCALFSLWLPVLATCSWFPPGPGWV